MPESRRRGVGYRRHKPMVSSVPSASCGRAYLRRFRPRIEARSGASKRRFGVAGNRVQRIGALAGSGSRKLKLHQVRGRSSRAQPLLGLSCFRSLGRSATSAPISKSNSDSRPFFAGKNIPSACAATFLGLPLLSTVCACGKPLPPARQSPGRLSCASFSRSARGALAAQSERGDGLAQWQTAAKHKASSQKDLHNRFGPSEVEGRRTPPRDVAGSVVGQRLNAGLGLGVVHAAAQVFPIRHQTADSGRKSVQASPGTSVVWLMMSNWPSA